VIGRVIVFLRSYLCQDLSNYEALAIRFVGGGLLIPTADGVINCGYMTYPCGQKARSLALRSLKI